MVTVIAKNINSNKKLLPIVLSLLQHELEGQGRLLILAILNVALQLLGMREVKLAMSCTHK